MQTSKNIYNFDCEKCNFHSHKKGDYTRHLKTEKHKKTSITSITSTKYVCNNCNGAYSHSSGLSRHKKKCKKGEISINNLVSTFKNELITMRQDHEAVLSKISASWKKEKKYIQTLEEENDLLKEKNDTLENKIRKYES